MPDAYDGETAYVRNDGAYYIFYISVLSQYVIHNALGCPPSEAMWLSASSGTDPAATYEPNAGATGPPTGYFDVNVCAEPMGIRLATEMGAIEITSDGADPDPAGVYVPMGWHGGQLYYQNQTSSSWYVVFYDYDRPEWSVQQLGPSTYPGDVWPSIHGWRLRSSDPSPDVISDEYEPYGIVRGKISIKAL